MEPLDTHASPSDDSLKAVVDLVKPLRGGDRPHTNEEAHEFLVRSLLNERGTLWPPGTMDQPSFLRKGVYSPLQVIAGEAHRLTSTLTELEYPHFHSFSSLLLSWLRAVQNEDNVLPAADGPEHKKLRRAVQELFMIRERHEERERLSLEIILKESETGAAATPRALEELARYFGRGVATVSLHDDATAKQTATVNQIFGNHLTAPSSIIYDLEAPFGHVNEGEISLCLKRDSHVTIAAMGNPLLEYYNGRWHIVDLQSGSEALETLLQERFGSAPIGFAEGLANLAYHLGTHWHSAILAVLEPTDADAIFEGQGSSSFAPQEIRAQFPNQPLMVQTDPEAKRRGYGRSLLSASIQDGCAVFSPDGEFHSVSRMLKSNAPLPTLSRGNAGTRAAAMIGQKGLAVKVSKDGPIRVFCFTQDRPLVPDDGLYIH